MRSLSPSHTGNNQRINRRRRKDAAIQKSMELWTSEFLIARQAENKDLNYIRSWVEQNTKPSWDEVRGSGLSVKAY